MAPPTGSVPSAPGTPARPPAVPPALVYDGDCTFCERCAAWIAARLPEGTPVIPSQEADLNSLGLDPHRASAAAWWIDADGGKHRGHRAIAAALQACGGSWRRLGLVLAAPLLSPIAAGVYELVARNRHRLGCRNCVERTRRGGPTFN